MPRWIAKDGIDDFKWRRIWPRYVRTSTLQERRDRRTDGYMPRGGFLAFCGPPRKKDAKGKRDPARV